MNLTDRVCPTAAQWERFLSSELPSHEQAEWERHLDGCSACATLLADAQHHPVDSLEMALAEVVRVAANGPTLSEWGQASCLAESSEENQIAGLIQRIQGLAHASEPLEWMGSRERASEVLWLLEPGQLPQSLGSLGHYDLLQFLGAGSSGVVFAARDRILQRDVAIKILRPALGPLAQERFLSEARAIASVVHQNIVTIYEVGQDQGLAFLTMPLLPGITLEQRLQQVTFLPENETRPLAAQVCAALDAAHQRRMIHRDIKPANIWLDSSGGQAKLLDFGLARAAELDATLTGTGLLAGTPSYMSPEQARGEELDPRSDLFSLGCLLYRCMTGRLPFAGASLLATLQAIQHQSPPPPQLVNSACSEELSRLIMALLEKDRERRPRSAQEVQQALNEPLAAWPFLHEANLLAQPLEETVVGRTEKLPVVPDSHEKSRESSGHPGSKRRRFVSPPWIALGLVLGTFFLGGFLLLTDVIRIQTADGEIVIETDDPNVQVEILQEGKLIEILDARSQRRLKIAAGTYSIQTSRSVDDAAIFQVSPGVIELTRGQQRIVKVSRVASPDGQAAPLDPSAPITPTASTYQGRTVEDWGRILAVEHDPKTLADGIHAFSKLMGDHVPHHRQGLELVRKIVRQHGPSEEGRLTGGGLTLRSAMDAFFKVLPPERTIEFIESEMLHGNLNSLTFLNSFNYFENLKLEKFRSALVTHRDSLVETYLQSLADRCQKQAFLEAEMLATNARGVQYWQFEIHDKYQSFLPQNSNPSGLIGGMGMGVSVMPNINAIAAELGPTRTNLIERFRQAYVAANGPQHRVFLAQMFNKFHVSNTEMARDMIDMANDPAASVDDRLQALGIVLNAVEPDIQHVLPQILQFADQLSTFPEPSPAYPMNYELHTPRTEPTNQTTKLELAGFVKEIRYFFNGFQEFDARPTPFSTLPIRPKDRLRLNVVEALRRLERLPADSLDAAQTFLRGQVRDFSPNEIHLATNGIKDNLQEVQRTRLSETYAQAVIHAYVQQTLAKWQTPMPTEPTE